MNNKITPIYTTKKLQKTIGNFISDQKGYPEGRFGHWNANLFFVNRKKCWLMVNSTTRYTLVLPNVQKKDLTNISGFFKQKLLIQLKNDKIDSGILDLDKVVGEIKLCPSNNDRSTMGTLNNHKLYFDDWIFQYQDFDSMPFTDLSGRLNSLPNKMLNWKYPKEVMGELIKAYA
tara:strand:- start:113 stop:634 length:522 start_codon:yes stop_codon:yes gene_type:complete